MKKADKNIGFSVFFAPPHNFFSNQLRYDLEQLIEMERIIKSILSSLELSEKGLAFRSFHTGSPSIHDNQTIPKGEF